MIDLSQHPYIMGFTKHITDGARDVSAEIENAGPDRYASAFERLVDNRDVRPVSTKLRIVYEHPDNDNFCILTPSENWMGLALAGDIIDTIEVVVLKDPHLSTKIRPCPALTEHQAIEYLLIKDVLLKYPTLLSQQSNRPRYAIVTAEQLSANRDLRQAWSLSPEVV